MTTIMEEDTDFKSSTKQKEEDENDAKLSTKQEDEEEEEDLQKPINTFSNNEFVTMRNPGKFEFQISKKDAWISQLIREPLEADPAFDCIDLYSIQHYDEMKFVIEYMQYHNGIEPKLILIPLRSYVTKEICFSTAKCPKDEPWDATFIDSKTELQLDHLTEIANFLGIASLLHLVCAKIASIIEKTEEPIEAFMKRMEALELSSLQKPIEKKEASQKKTLTKKNHRAKRKQTK